MWNNTIYFSLLGKKYLFWNFRQPTFLVNSFLIWFLVPPETILDHLHLRASHWIRKCLLWRLDQAFYFYLARHNLSSLISYFLLKLAWSTENNRVSYWRMNEAHSSWLRFVSYLQCIDGCHIKTFSSFSSWMNYLSFPLMRFRIV